jgi:Tfp pilus assembly protein PilX
MKTYGENRAPAPSKTPGESRPAGRAAMKTYGENRAPAPSKTPRGARSEAVRDQRGVALVQVLIMSVLLTILATGLLRMTFGSHIMVSKVRHTDIRKSLAEACMARKISEWQQTGGSCVAQNPACTFASQNATVRVTCPSGRAVFTVNN